MEIPLMDLKKQYNSIKHEIDPVVQSVLNSAHFIGGPEKEAFEREFAEACGARHCLGVGNGTDSLMIALKSMSIGPGDEVIVPANSFIATSEMVTASGAKPVFVDVNESDFLLNLDLVEKMLETRSWTKGGKIKALIPVHLYGRLCNMDRIMGLASHYQLFVIEDAAQSHLAARNGKRCGSIGHAGSFSFYPGKNLGAYGDGGALTTNDPALYKKMKMLANHGRVDKYNHEFEGFNSRLDALQAAILRVKLRHLTKWTNMRQEKADVYRKLLTKENLASVILPESMPQDEHVYHLYVVRVPQRNRIQARLKENGIECVVHYPTALPLLKAYSGFGHTEADFPIASRLQNEILSLPLYPEIALDEQKYVVRSLVSAIKEL